MKTSEVLEEASKEIEISRPTVIKYLKELEDNSDFPLSKKYEDLDSKSTKAQIWTFHGENEHRAESNNEVYDGVETNQINGSNQKLVDKRIKNLYLPVIKRPASDDDIDGAKQEEVDSMIESIDTTVAPTLRSVATSLAEFDIKMSRKGWAGVAVTESLVALSGGLFYCFIILLTKSLPWKLSYGKFDEAAVALAGISIVVLCFASSYLFLKRRSERLLSPL